MRSVWKYSALLGFSALFGLLLGWSNLGRALDAWAYDFLLRLHPPPAQPSAAVILAIDEDSLEAYGGLLNLRTPLAEALQTVSRHQPRAVAIDIVLSEPGAEAENQALEQALAQFPNVVLATHLTAAGDTGQGRWEEPLDRFSVHAAALGHVHAEPDQDGVTRRLLLAKANGRTRRWAMALEAYRLAQGSESIRETPEGLEVGSAFIPAPQREGRSLRIRYVNPESPIERVSLKQVLQDPDAASLVRGRVVFVGVNVVGGLDRYLMTPYSFGQAMSGVEINANAYETLARMDFLTTISDSAVLSVSALAALLLGVSFWKLSGRWTLTASGAVLFCAHAVPLALFQSSYVFAAGPIVLVTWASFLAGGGYHYLVVRRQLGRAESQRDRYQRAVHYVTHEMRTPLTTIQGSSELMSRYTLPEEKQKEIAATIHRESQRLGRMVEMFLSVERLAADQLELRNERVEAGEIIGSCIERVRPLAARKNIDIRHVPAAEAPLWGDRELLEYACYNLVTNAVKYSPANTSIIVRAWHNTENVCISVEDQGYGLDESEIRQIFRRFYRTRKAQESGAAGAGLGLALVEEIVVQHGGSIEVESRVNHGSRFTLSIPRARRVAVQTV